MANFNDVNNGALFRNDKRTKENQPTHKGQITCLCPECNKATNYWLSAWVKTAGPQAKNPGSKFFSLAVDPKDRHITSEEEFNKQPEDYDEDVPF